MARIPTRFVPIGIEAEVGDDSTVVLSNGHTVGAGAAAAAPAAAVKGSLDVEVHHARDIHNICIHQKQDVYAKLYILEGGVETNTYCTNVVSKGGKDPVFNHKFQTSPVGSDSVLRCEVWMSSKLKGYLEDQQLGTVSVPLSNLVGKKKQFMEYQLSTTELFYSPAGSLSMTLEFRLEAASTPPVAGTKSGQKQSVNEPCDSGSCTSACSDGDTFSVLHSSTAIQFTDLDAALEDEELVSDFIRKRGKRQSMASKDGILTGPPYLTGDCTSTVEDEQAGDKSQEGHVDENSVVEQQEKQKQDDEQPLQGGADNNKVVDAGQNDSNIKCSGAKKKLQVAVSTSSSFLESSVSNSLTPSSRQKEEVLSSTNNSDGELGKLVVPEFVPEPRILQEEIMDMYMKSMQQFSEALAKMQLPVVDENGMIKPESTSNAAAAAAATDAAPAATPAATKNDSADTRSDSGKTSNNGPSKVFYGSRAFF